MNKITATQIKSLKEFYRSSDNGVLKSSDWTTGSGRYTSRRAVPPFVKEYSRNGSTAHNGTSYAAIDRKAADFLAANPRVQKILVLDVDAMIEALHGVEVQ